MDGCKAEFQDVVEYLETSGVTFCQPRWDSAVCWPPTLAGTVAFRPCPKIYDGIRIHVDGYYNASRFCQENGTWSGTSDYEACINNSMIHSDGLEADILFQTLHDQSAAQLGILIVYVIGYVSSLFASFWALWLFWFFRTFHSLRNVLHANLSLTYLLLDLTWIIMTVVALKSPSEILNEDQRPSLFCRAIMTIFVYFHLTNFFWMLAEGASIAWVVVRSNNSAPISYWPFGLIGWGVPVIALLVWIPMKITNDDHSCWWPEDMASTFNMVYIGPMLFVLLANVIFLVVIMFALVRKYRNAVPFSTSTRRSVKNFFVLLPLLGITYVLVLVIPPLRDDDLGVVRIAMQYISAVLNSFQGLFVAILYCFMNNEIRAAIKLRGNSWFPIRRFLKIDSSRGRRKSLRTLLTVADHSSPQPGTVNVRPPAPALSKYCNAILDAEGRGHRSDPLWEEAAFRMREYNRASQLLRIRSTTF